MDEDSRAILSDEQARRGIADRVIASIREAADPSRAVRDALVDAPREPFDLLAIGKASRTMAAASEAVAPCAHGLVIAVPGASGAGTEALDASRIALLEADHPLPTERNLEAAERVRAFVRMTDRPLLVLLSGGGSAQLTLPAGDLTLTDVRTVADELMRAGATITELNAVRKHLDLVKGGQLAEAAARAGRASRVLLVSDVMGDPLDVISSGPFAPDPTTYAGALAVLQDRGVGHARVHTHLTAGAAGEHPETPKPGDACFGSVTHEVIANHQSVARAAVRALRAEGLEVTEPSLRTSGEASERGRVMAATLSDESPGAIACVAAGETTVSGVGEGARGGPCQEFALAAALELERRGLADWLVLAFATDGIDGPTDAAGAVVTPLSLRRAGEAGIDPGRALAEHDSYPCLDAAGAMVRTGPTGTNVNDVYAIVRTPSAAGEEEPR